MSAAPHTAKVAGKTVTGSLAQISAAWADHRDRKGLGSSRYKPILIQDGSGADVAYVSYNARVWPGTSYDPRAEALYTPGQA